jgi:2-hydroxy-3-keto-5-methylthiopentenyl-1-phosphate phosphatase
MTILEECLEVLGNDAIVLSEKETQNISDEMEQMFPVSNWGRIDWEKVKRKIDLDSSSNIIEYLNMDGFVYIIWSEGTLPVIKADFRKVIEVIDEVTAVSFDTWLLNPNEKWVIEFYHEGDIMIGYSM